MLFILNSLLALKIEKLKETTENNPETNLCLNSAAQGGDTTNNAIEIQDLKNSEI
jgi:hypothetical protein